jgi:hypothetical protein
MCRTMVVNLIQGAQTARNLRNPADAGRLFLVARSVSADTFHVQTRSTQNISRSPAPEQAYEIKKARKDPAAGAQLGSRCG